MSSTATTKFKFHLETQVVRTGEWVTSGHYTTVAQAQRDASTLYARRQARITSYQVEL